ncbi:MAG: peptidoglycan-binding protein, partial [Gammaproteobacteria bacterium]|nr:peptidoglycan-binding protein [Gammaproteobacteria bacterium]
DVLEQVRLLTNLETNTQKLLQIILIGQPELRELLSRNELRQLAQRITGRYHLSPLSREEAAAYVRHRLRVAGATSDLFGAGALREVFRLSQGVPRVINVICDRALLAAYTLDQHRVSAALVRQAATEVFGRRFTPAWLPWAAIAGLAVVLCGGTLALWQTHPWTHRGAVAPVSRAAPPSTAATAPLTPASHPATPPAALGALLRAHAAQTDTDSAFRTLFDLWGAKYQPSTVDPCTQASQQGLECVSERGSFGQLRLYNHPAILLLNDGQGASHQVVLRSLGQEQAQLELDGTRSVGIGELSRYWLGDFVMLWRPAKSPVLPLSVGMRGEPVRWLRESLLRLRGETSTEPVSDVFDAELSAQVREFQRQRQLTVDGIAGVQTQIALAGAVAGPNVPLLSAADTHHGG